ncbi:MAG TPA: PFL family protein [Xanthobacteraceae bacterium]|nr:PFL family protein [Xanthobacteraceae bacterium]
MRQLNFSGEEILETISMVRTEQLDIRTITVGISLFDCVSDETQALCENVFRKITRVARDLHRVSSELTREFGIPIVNNRIAVTPISLIAGKVGQDRLLALAKTLDRAALELKVDFIGGFSAHVEKGMTPIEAELLATLPEALAATGRVCASVNVGTTRAGLNMDAIAEMGRIVKRTAAATAANNSIGCAKLVVFCNAVEDNPFMAGAFHGTSEADSTINVGVSGPGVVLRAIQAAGNVDFGALTAVIRRTAFKITRAGELIGRAAAARLGIPFGIVDLSLAPTPAEGDSIARILEEIGVDRVGTHGSTAALAMLNDAVKKGGAMASSYVGGLSGAFIPVSEDAGMIEAAARGTITIDKLEAMSSVCSVGLDMIAIPGDTPAETISAIIADEAAIGMINKKTTAVRLIPAVGKKVGDNVDFGGLLGHAPVLAVHSDSSARFIARGGRIPAPLQALIN